MISTFLIYCKVKFW